MDTGLDGVLERIPNFVYRIGLRLVELVEHVFPKAEALEPFAGPIGWGIVLVAVAVIAISISGLASRR